MSYMYHGLASAHFQAEDDLDRLFSRLAQVEPADEVIARILTRIRHLPAPVPTVEYTRQGLAQVRSDALIVQNEKQEPS